MRRAMCPAVAGPDAALAAGVGTTGRSQCGNALASIALAFAGVFVSRRFEMCFENFEEWSIASNGCAFSTACVT